EDWTADERSVETAEISGNSSADDGTSTRKLRGSDRPRARIRERDSTSNVSDVKSIFGSEYQERRTAGSDLRSSRDIPAIIILIPRGMDRCHWVDFNLPSLKVFCCTASCYNQRLRRLWKFSQNKVVSI